jgi:FkbM family methyltransferase
MAPVLRAARRAKYFFENETFRAYVQNIEVEGERFQFRIADPVGRRWYGEADWSHFKQIELLKEMTAPDDVVFYCGAHHGMMCLPVARRLRDAHNMICVEAHPRNAKILRENLRLNGLGAAQVIERAVGGSTGEVEFVDNGNAAVAAHDRALPHFRVRMDTLDNFCAELGVWPTLVVLDIEGAEVGALEGAAKLLARRPKWQIEVHSPDIRQRFGEDPNRIWELLGPGDYAFRVQEEDRSGEAREVDRCEFVERVQLYAVPR